jgi:flavin reductase
MSANNSLNDTEIKTAFSRIGKSIAVITLADADGRQATISSAFTYLTQQPPTLLLALEKSSSLYGKLTAGQRFAVNVLGDGHQAVVDACARQKGEARFSVGDWQLQHDVPVLADAQAAFVCELAQLNEFETHGLLVASVKAIAIHGEVSPLIYVGGGLQVCG